MLCGACPAEWRPWEQDKERLDRGWHASEGVDGREFSDLEAAPRGPQGR